MGGPTGPSAPHRYTLILSDINMPVMDGKQAARLIREKGFEDVPIIAITADVMEGDKEAILEAGMNDYISKPIRRTEVLEMIKKWAAPTPI